MIERAMAATGHIVTAGEVKGWRGMACLLMVALLSLLPACVDAQELTVVSLRETTDIMFADKQVKDYNGDICALVKVLLPVEGADFEEDFRHVFKTSEYWVYMSPGKKYLRVKCPWRKPLLVYFPDYIEGGVKAKKIYELDLSGYPGREEVKSENRSRGQTLPSTHNYLGLRVSPPNAEVSVDGIMRQLNADGEVNVLLTQGSHTYSVSAAGYATRTGTVELNERQTLEISLESTMADLVVRVSPGNATMVIDGEVRTLEDGGTTLTLSKGSHTYSVSAAGYATQTGTVELNERQTLEISLESTVADLVVRVSPGNATMVIDGEARTLEDGGTTLTLSKGSHTYSVSAAGYATRTGTVELNERQTLEISLESTMARLTLTCETSGATFYVNDQQKGTGSWSGDLIADTYLIEARKEGYRPQSRTVTLSELEKRTETFAALTAITGSLNVNYMPIDAEVWIDGEKAGLSPDRFSVMVGSHKVELRKAGYASKTESAIVKEGEETLIEGELTKGNERINGHEAVDLGLSVKWARCNVGANTPGEYGDYYAWGETATKSKYTEKNSKTYGKAIGDIGGTSRDVAQEKWGGTWRLPTKAEFDELLDKCTWTWTTWGGYSGYKVTGKNGNSIFLPAAGSHDGTSLGGTGSYGYYWSSTPDGSNTRSAYHLFFGSGYCGTRGDYRRSGRSVRPVAE